MYSIQFLTLSLRNYVVVKYINRPLEFYDAKTGVFLREMVTNPPSFSCIDWIPNHGRHKTPKVGVVSVWGGVGVASIL